MKPYISDKKILESMKRTKHWDHDIQYIDGRFIEDVVKEFQQSKDEDMLLKIVGNYRIFRATWARAFAPYCDNDLEAGEAMHDEIIWRSAARFDMSKTRKPKGKAFNAYVVSALLNSLKNHRSAKMSHKNYPRVLCPICNEEVYEINEKHLRHSIDMERYKKMFSKYPLVSLDGMVTCPHTGESVFEITESYLNHRGGVYGVDDFRLEYEHLMPKLPFRCPITLIDINEPLTSEFPGMILPGYTEDQFVKEFDEYPGIIECPFSNKKLLEVTQGHLDKVIKQNDEGRRYTLDMFLNEYPNATLKAKRVDVLNPFTGQKVPEITPEMLRAAGTNVKEYLEENAEIYLDKWYPTLITCPFTGRKTRQIRRADLDRLDKTVFEFYHAVCKNPMRKWQVQCGACGDYVDNIWTHLDRKVHGYAEASTLEEFQKTYGSCATRVIVSTNSFFVNDSGDTVHIADLFAKSFKDMTPMEIEDSLLKAADTELDHKIANAIRTSQTLEDVCHLSAEHKVVMVPVGVPPGRSRAVKEAIRKHTGIEDFDLVEPPAASRKVQIMIPSRDTIRARLLKMIELSDIETQQPV